MKRLVIGIVAVGGLTVLAGPAWGQAFARPGTAPFTYTQPPVSPYLNLLRGGNPAVNYFGLVRPEQNFYNQLQQGQLQQGQLQQQGFLGLSALPTGAEGIVLLETGVPARFMNFSHYYGSRISGAATLSPLTVAPATIPPVTVPFNTTGGFIQR